MDSNIEIFMKHSSMLLKVYGIERPKHEAAIIFKNILNKSYTNILTNNDLKIPIQKRNEILENAVIENIWEKRILFQRILCIRKYFRPKTRYRIDD